MKLRFATLAALTLSTAHAQTLTGTELATRSKNKVFSQETLTYSAPIPSHKLATDPDLTQNLYIAHTLPCDTGRVSGSEYVWALVFIDANKPGSCSCMDEGDELTVACESSTRRFALAVDQRALRKYLCTAVKQSAAGAPARGTTTPAR